MSSYRPMPRLLETERLTLRPAEESDAGELRSLVSERGKGTPTVERSREVIATGHARTAATGLALLHVRRRAEGDFIDYCGLIVGRSTVEEPEIAYELFRRVHGRGYATEAAGAVLNAATATGRERLWATVRTWNARRSASSRSSVSPGITSPPTTSANWSGSPARCREHSLRGGPRGCAVPVEGGHFTGRGRCNGGYDVTARRRGASYTAPTPAVRPFSAAARLTGTVRRRHPKQAAEVSGRRDEHGEDRIDGALETWE